MRITFTGKQQRGFPWYKHLQEAVASYNNSYHRTIKQKPIDVWKQVSLNNQKIEVVEPNLQVGDTVRTITQKKVFDKGDVLKTSKERYTIVEKSDKRYRIKNIRTGDTIKRLYPSFELVVSAPIHSSELEKTPHPQPNLQDSEKRIEIPKESAAPEPVRFVGTTPVKVRRVALKRN